MSYQKKDGRVTTTTQDIRDLFAQLKCDMKLAMSPLKICDMHTPAEVGLKAKVTENKGLGLAECSKEQMRVITKPSRSCLTYLLKVFVCMSNNRTDAVNRLFIIHSQKK